jgi:hypothetical protein
MAPGFRMRMTMAKKRQPDAETWLMKDAEGVLQPVRVVDMASTHLYHWIRHFRKKYRDLVPEIANKPDSVVDTLIQVEMVTAPAIYAEATKRGLLAQEKSTAHAPREQGSRRIELED